MQFLKVKEDAGRCHETGLAVPAEQMVRRIFVEKAHHGVDAGRRGERGDIGGGLDAHDAQAERAILFQPCAVVRANIDDEIRRIEADRFSRAVPPSGESARQASSSFPRHKDNRKTCFPWGWCGRSAPTCNFGKIRPATERMAHADSPRREGSNDCSAADRQDREIPRHAPVRKLGNACSAAFPSALQGHRRSNEKRRSDRVNYRSEPNR